MRGKPSAPNYLPVSELYHELTNDKLCVIVANSAVASTNCNSNPLADLFALIELCTSSVYSWERTITTRPIFKEPVIPRTIMFIN